MKAFDNTTTDGNEKAIRKGKRVPPDDVNLAFYKAPEFSPEENLVIIDTSQLSENSIKLNGTGCKLFYANETGVLVDDTDNVVVTDSSPAVTDAFLPEEDYSYTPGSEYSNSDILPYEHRSRYFHLEKAGLSFAGLATTYSSESVKVVDKKGQEYPRYKVRLIPATVPGYSLTGDNWAYRVLVYIDKRDVEDLHLRYSKIEIDPNGNMSPSPDTDYQEILNPRSFFKKVPEEADVVDPTSFNKKIFATTPVSADSVDVGRGAAPGVDGYKVYVPKKAVPDPRIYQLFRWRIHADFIQDRVTDPGSDSQTIKCGVLKLSTSTSTHCDFALMNLDKSRFNASGVEFVNPLASDSNKERRSYWHVNLDKDDLSEFDLLLFSPKNPGIDIKPYLPKLMNFIKNEGGTVFVDTFSRIDFFKDLGGVLSKPVKPWGGANYAGSSTVSGSQSTNTADLTLDFDSELLDANDSLGGWNLDDVDYLTARSFVDGRFAQFFDSIPADAEAVVTSGGKALLSDRALGEGRLIVSTMANLLTASNLYDYIDNARLIAGKNPINHSNYKLNINGEGVEGAYKLLYNAALVSTKSRVLDDSDETSYSSSWRFNTKWRASWVINASDGVLDDDEKQRHNFAVDATDPENDDFSPVWKRKLSTKTIERLVDEELVDLLQNDPVLASRVNQSNRQYSIEVTNPKVETGTIHGEDIPQAWTTAYSPRFTVPDDLAPFIVREAVDKDGKKGLKPEFGPGEYEHREYPETPYGGRVRILNATSQEILTTEKTNFTVQGTATGAYDVEEENPDIITQVPVTTSTSVLKELSWASAHKIWQSGKGSPTSPGTKFAIDSFPEGYVRPYGMRTWQDYNYKNSKFGNGNLLWPYMGFQSRILRGSSGDLVRFVQTALNRFRAAGYLSISKLSVDGQFGSGTRSAVIAFQNAIGARYVDGIVDAESWWLIHAWIQRLQRQGKAGDNYLGYFDDYGKMSQHRISDGSKSAYAKRSWVKGGPSTVWELFAITFDQQYKMEGVSITPHGIGSTSDIMFRAVHVQNTNSLYNFDADTCFLKYMSHRPKVGQKFTLPFNQRKGNTLVVGVGQDKPYKSGSSSRYLGVSEIAARVRITESDTTYQTVVEDGGTSVVEYRENFNFTVNGTVTVTADRDAVVTLQYPGGHGYKSVSNVSFNSISVSNSNVLASIVQGNKAKFTTQVIDTAQGSEVKEGPSIPDDPSVFYSMTTDGQIDNIPETGWVNKSEGVKLLCNADGTPYGFPDLPASSGDLDRHYMNITLIPDGNGPDTDIGFYDIDDQEFITSASGKPEMSYLNYFSRGPQNVYIAVVSEYETTEQRLIPDDLDAPRLPYKRAMPVYGVCVEKGNEITLESPPGGLSIRDVWPIAVRTGQYRRKKEIRSRSEGKITGYLGAYQGSEVQAIYSIPEAAIDSGSAIYGPEKEDIVAEQPKILDDHVIRVRQYPIHQAERYVHGTSADPVSPVFTVYKRSSVSDPWEELDMSEIKDYNISTGEIFLKTPLTSMDSSLLKVDYTSAQPFYSMTATKSNQKVNLNVFLQMMDGYTDKPIYVYMVPHYVLDSSGQPIEASYNERVLEITSDPGIFDTTSPDYHPLAVQLGVIYTSNATDINDLALFDTRTRGGGAKNGLTTQELTRLVTEATSYWDVKYPSTVSYPKQGYVRVQIPSSVRDYLEDERIEDTIRRNLTAGAGFDIDFVDA